MSLTSQIQRNYAQIKNIGTGAERETSKILPIRDFNNFAKSVLIQIALLQKRQNITILDLACGKGGDLLKYRDPRITYYVGVDITLESLIEAMKRYNEAVFKAQLRHQVMYQADFIFADAFQAELQSHAPRNLKFNIISCEFALHYAFKSEDSARQLFETVKHFLARNGSFIATFPSKTTIINRLDNLGIELKGNFELENELFEIEFENVVDDLNEPGFGKGYYFELAEAVAKTQEFLIDIRDLKKVLEQCGLQIRKEFPSLEDLCSSDMAPRKQLERLPLAMKKSARVLSRMNKEIETNGELGEDFWNQLGNDQEETEQEVLIGQRQKETVPDITSLKQIPQIYLDVINLYEGVIIEHADNDCEDGCVVQMPKKVEPRKLVDLVNLTGEVINVESLIEQFEDRMWEPACE